MIDHSGAVLLFLQCVLPFGIIFLQAKEPSLVFLVVKVAIDTLFCLKIIYFVHIFEEYLSSIEFYVDFFLLLAL